MAELCVAKMLSAVSPPLWNPREQGQQPGCMVREGREGAAVMVRGGGLQSGPGRGQSAHGAHEPQSARGDEKAEGTAQLPSYFWQDFSCCFPNFLSGSYSSRRIWGRCGVVSMGKVW